jgi:hypothetical protein
MLVTSELQMLQWLMPVILASWEDEIRRVTVSGQPGQKKFMRLHLKRKKLDVIEYDCHHRDLGSIK